MKRPRDFVLVVVGGKSEIHIARRLNPHLTLCGKRASQTIHDYSSSAGWCVRCASKEESLINGPSNSSKRHPAVSS